LKAVRAVVRLRVETSGRAPERQTGLVHPLSRRCKKLAKVAATFRPDATRNDKATVRALLTPSAAQHAFRRQIKNR